MWRSWAVRLVMACIVLSLPAVHAIGGGTAAEQRSGSGWVSFGSFLESPDHDFIREFLENWEDYQLSQAPGMMPWSMEELRVGYWDLNDDGVEEMFVSFAEVSSYFCGTAGCWILIFEKRDRQWQYLTQDRGFHVQVTDEKEELSVTESIDSWDIREKREGYRRIKTGYICDPIDPAVLAKMPDYCRD